MFIDELFKFKEYCCRPQIFFLRSGGKNGLLDWVDPYILDLH